MDRDPRSLVHPGPDDASILHLQGDHRSTAIWEGIKLPPLHCRRSEAPLRRVTITDDRVIQHLRTVGFYGAYYLRYIQLDCHLITTLVERWRAETHTFHLPVGEATITLQDIAVLLDLPVDRIPVCGVDTVRDVQHWSVLCTELLGFTPADGAIDKSTLRLSALVEHLAHEIPGDATKHFIACYARSYIFLLIRGFLFGDKSSSRVKLMFLLLLGDLHVVNTFSWGSAALAWLYREMCIVTKRDAKDISGPLILLQLWAWERLLHIVPQRVLPRQRVAHAAAAPDGDGVALDGVGVDLGVAHDGPLGCRCDVTFSEQQTPRHVLRHYRDKLDQMREDQMI